MKELTRRDDGKILCECRKCYQICRDGVYLIPRTYRNHKKYRDLDPDEEEVEHCDARAAFFKTYGQPNASSASSSSSQTHTRQRKKKPKKTTVPPLPLDEDIMDEDPPNPFMDDAPMQEDAPTQGDASVGRARDQEEAIDPSPARGTCDESDEEDPEDSEDEEGAPGPVPEFEQPQLEEEPEDKDEGHDSTDIPLDLNDLLPQPTLPRLVLTKDMIDDVKAARLEDDLNEEMLERLRNPPKEPESLSPDILFSMALFNNLVGGSQQMYHDACQTIKHFTGRTLESYHKLSYKPICPFKGLDKCPECNEDRYQKNKKSGKLQPRQQFYTIPLGPQLQAMWRTPEGADRMRYRNRKTDEIIQKILKEHKISSFEDIFDGFDGLVGHNGHNGCRLSCGMPGRHPPGKPTYYPVVLQPNNYTITKCNHADYDLSELRPPDAMKYQQDLRKVLISPNETRLRLPNGQIARCAWKELENEASRNSRNVKLLQYQRDHSFHFGEVQFYFQAEVAHQQRTLAMVSRYSDPDEDLLKDSSDTLRVVSYEGAEALCIIDTKSICSVVAMVPFILSSAEKQNPITREQCANCFFVGEKPFLDFTSSTTDPSPNGDNEAQPDEES
ncbi:hypothetical protein F5887DRAFT_920244 [Amanita rubescens]|nr:hypothetical protein F5887DRAFT_920244 [Amanita rubescens]